MLGVPLGSDSFCSDFVRPKLLGKSVKVMAQLADFEDSQAAMYLLRLSYGIVRATHFMRTTPLPQWSDVAIEFDKLVRKAASEILGTLFPGNSYEQACLSTKIGGLGLRRVVDHANVAFTASWHEAVITSGEKGWSRPDSCDEKNQTQRIGSIDVDEKKFNDLLLKSNERDVQRLHRLNLPHANAWLTALPSSDDGKDTVLPPPIFNTCVFR